ncbi:hypothetical protein [Archaeoglobus profundus]|uniref:Uncharacterized protein n=1 Tax=Archaeoglobus profundus (strain DSM 5631 / JCM 9629 / NBRC 100127 / Av18) TaxID=572546 RepID=D2REV4_ARCPA|nr:hypothetical protein [Archaeoglobus profundus]ADB58648.1 hypothetical protein Arcpr_1602 [Archaeoglobus profundus DSM 5631]
MTDHLKRESYRIGIFVEIYRELSDRYYWVKYDLLTSQLERGLYISTMTDNGLPMVKMAFRNILDKDEMYNIWDLFRSYLKRHLYELMRKGRVSKKQVYRLLNKTPPLSETIGRFEVRVEDSFGYVYGLSLDEAKELGEKLEQLLENALVLKGR